MSSEPRVPLGAFIIPGLVACAGVFGVVRNLDTQAHLSEGSAAEIVDTRYRKNKPSAPVIEVDGEQYVCAGGLPSTKLGGEVRYDPEDPSDCRDADAVGVMTPQQRFGLGLSIAALAFAGFLLFRVMRDG